MVRLLSVAINRRRKEITGDHRTLPLRRLLLRNSFTLDHGRRFLLNRWLQRHPELNEVYRTKEALHSLYRVKVMTVPRESSPALRSRWRAPSCLRFKPYEAP